MFKNSITVLFIAVFFLSFPAIEKTEASIFKSGGNIHISRLHQIDDDLYSFGDDIQIDGTIDGDLISIGGQVTIQGEIKRSANLLGRSIDHSGTVNGSLRACGQIINISGRVGGSVLAGGERLTLAPEARVERDLNFYGKIISIDGMVKGTVHAGGEKITLTGTVTGDVYLEGNEIEILPPAVIVGNLVYTSPNEIDIDQSGVNILGDTEWLGKLEDEEDNSSSVQIAVAFSMALAAFLFGWIAIRLFSNQVNAALDQLHNKLGLSLGIGFIGLFVIALCITVLGLASISALLGRVLIASDQTIIGSILMIVSLLLIPIVSLISVAGGVVFYSSSILVSLFAGLLITAKKGSGNNSPNLLALLVGLTLTSILFAIPIIGWIICLLVTLTGAGAIFLGFKATRKTAPSKIENKPTSGSQ